MIGGDCPNVTPPNLADHHIGASGEVDGSEDGGLFGYADPSLMHSGGVNADYTEIIYVCGYTLSLVALLIACGMFLYFK